MTHKLFKMNKPIPMTKTELDALKVGDRITRMLAGAIPMPLTVTAIDDMIRCGFDDVEWDFHRETGCEIDMRFGWDGITKTGSFLRSDKP
jgi:hypothetical protein